MLRRFAVLVSILRIILLQCIIFIIINEVATAQNAYTLNYEGSVCYIKYLCFTPDGNYSNTRRPNIFILGEENQTAQQIFDTDTLKKSSKYNNFQFNYIPCQGASIEKKLSCIESLVSVITNRFENGRGNLFLQINDIGIKQSDIVLYGLKNVFTAVRYPFPAQQNLTESDIFIEFKENVSAYGPEIKLKNDGGSYYIEKDKEKIIVTEIEPD